MIDKGLNREYNKANLLDALYGAHKKYSELGRRIEKSAPDMHICR